MKLLEKNTRQLLKLLPLVMLACTVLFFIMLEIQTHHLQEVQLLLKQENVLRKFNTGEIDSDKSIIGEFEITTDKAIPAGAFKGPVDTLIFYPSRNEYVPFEMMATHVTRNGKTFQLSTFVSSVEISHLKVAVFGAQFLIYLILFFAIFRINNQLSKILWKPFYSTMGRLKNYDINTHDTLSLPDSGDVDEFNDLNKAIEELSDRNHQAFINQKQFVENASHEIQTPLAIIRSKVDILMEQADLNEKSAALIQDIADANNRLSKLNTTLILLSKIQNQQYLQIERIEVSALLEKLQQTYQNYYLELMPKIKGNIEKDVYLSMNPELAEILFSNLLKNAIVHNSAAGYINWSLTKSEFVIENPGQDLSVDTASLFDRFRTGANDKKTTGLGLALVKQICDLYHFNPVYTFKNGVHKLRIKFTS